MLRLILVMLGTIVVAIFVLANSHHVDVSLIFGAPVRVRMIVVLASVYAMGFLSAVVFHHWQRVRRRRDFEEARKAAAAAEHGPQDIADL